MKQKIAESRASLVGLHRLADKTEASERGILKRAEARLAEVIAMLERQRAGVDGASDAAQDRYLGLVEERAQLQIVIAKAKQTLER